MLGRHVAEAEVLNGVKRDPAIIKEICKFALHCQPRNRRTRWRSVIPKDVQ
jgi:hypothetical protein